MKTESGYLLIVEDDPDILKWLEATLTFRGHRVITAHNGREGLEVIQKERPDIIIADIMMPQLDGFGFVHRLRIAPETREIPVVFITATYVEAEDREFAMSIGATRFIQKPVDLEKFLGTVSDLLEEGPPAAITTLDELRFYDEYRKRLSAKLAQKSKQIARDELLIGSESEQEDHLLMASIHEAMKVREEIQVLLAQVDAQIEKCVKPPQS